MFNSRLVSVLCYIVGVLLIVKVVLMKAMFIWSYFGTPPLQVFSVPMQGVLPYVLLAQELGVSIFAFVVVAAIEMYAHGHHKVAAKKKTTK